MEAPGSPSGPVAGASVGDNQSFGPPVMLVNGENDFVPYLASTVPPTVAPADCALFDFIMASLITGLLCVLGFIGNTLSIVVLWQEKNHASLTFLMQALITSDIGFVWMVFIEDVVPGLALVIPLLRECTWVCRRGKYVTGPLRTLSQICVTWFTFCAAYNRQAVTSPSKAGVVCTLEFARKQVIVVLAAAVLLSVPVTFQSTIKLPGSNGFNHNLTRHALVDNVRYQQVYVHGVVFVAGTMIPLLLTSYMLLRLVRSSNSARMAGPGRRGFASTHKSENTEMTQVLLTLCITLLVCYTPTSIRSILHWTHPDIRAPCGSLHYYLAAFCTMFLVLNSSIKVLIFSLFAGRFWDTLKQQFCWRKDKPSPDHEIWGMYRCADMSEMTLISHVESPR